MLPAQRGSNPQAPDHNWSTSNWATKAHHCSLYISWEMNIRVENRVDKNVDRLADKRTDKQMDRKLDPYTVLMTLVIQMNKGSK